MTGICVMIFIFHFSACNKTPCTYPHDAVVGMKHVAICYTINVQLGLLTYSMEQSPS
jgi:hypothetical protein